MNDPAQRRSRQHAETELQDIADRMRVQCAELVPALRERERKAERLRRLPQETIDDLERVGIFKISVPREYGGYELDCGQQNRIIAEVARGSGSTSFVMSIIQASTWWCSLYDHRAGEEVFTNAQGPRANGILMPRGTLKRRGENYVLNGVWPFGSAGQHVEWGNVGAVTDPEDGPEETVLVLCPMREAEILDDWDVGGYAATGSNSVRIDNLEVPAHRVLPLGPALEGEYPCDRQRPLYRSLFVPFTLGVTTGPAVGLARGALEVFLERIHGRPITFTHYDRQEEAPVTHSQVAEAAMLIDEAQFHADRVTDTVVFRANGEAEWTTADRVRARADAARAVQLSYQAIDILYLASGGSVIHNSEFLQHAKRDISAISVHGAFSSANTLELLGRVMCGQDPMTPII